MKSLVWILVLLLNNVLPVRNLHINKFRKVKLHTKYTELKDPMNKKYDQKQIKNGNIVEMLRKLGVVSADGFVKEVIIPTKSNFPSVINKIDLVWELQKTLFQLSDQNDNSLKNIMKLEYNGQPDLILLPNSTFEDVNRLKVNGFKAEHDNEIDPVIIVIEKRINEDWAKTIKDSNWIGDKTKEKQSRSNNKCTEINYKRTNLKRGHSKCDHIVYRVKSKCTEGKYYKVDPCNLCFCSKNMLQCTAVRCTKKKAILSKGYMNNGLKNQDLYKKLRDEATACEPGAHKVVKDGNESCPCTCVMPSVLYCPLCPAVEKLNITRIKKMNAKIQQKTEYSTIERLLDDFISIINLITSS